MKKSFVHRTSSLRTFFDSNALWLSMVIGAVGYKLFLPLKPILPWLIFFMLFFTFCKVNPLDLRLRKWHWAVLAAQLVLSFATYALIMCFTHNTVLAQGLFMCFIMPTATAAPIIAGKMGGSIQNLTTFTLLSNFATAIIVPATFPLITNYQLPITNYQLPITNHQLPITNYQLPITNYQLPITNYQFLSSFLLILSRIAPLLLGPFFSAWLLRLGFNAYYRRKKNTNHQSPITNREFVLPTKLAVIPFYLWVASIVVLMATVTQTTITNFQSQITNILILLVSSFFACLIQFGLGKLIGYYLPAPNKGKDYQDVLINPDAAPKNMNEVSSITAGQAFGQKNTSLGVWMAHTFLNPLASLGAAAYIIWQNVFNSVQLFVVAHKKAK